MLGLLGRRDVRLAYVGFVLVGAAGLFLLLQDPLADVSPAAITIALAVGAGVAMFAWLSAMLAPRR